MPGITRVAAERRSGSEELRGSKARARFALISGIAINHRFVRANPRPFDECNVSAGGGFARFADLVGAENREKVLQRAVKLWGTGV